MPPPTHEPPRAGARRALYLAGLSVRTSNPDEREGAGRIASLWEQWFRRRGEVPWTGDPIAAYVDYASDQDGPYTLFVGVERPAGADVPAGWSTCDVPAADGLMFATRGSMPQAVFGAWQRIGSWFEAEPGVERAFTADVEFHRDDGVDVHVATQPRDARPGGRP